MSEYRVLLVEDNAVNALMVRTMLERVENPRFAVSHADSLVKALDVLAHGGFDAALVDLNLPDSAGLETFLAIQRNAAGLAIVVLSGVEDEALSMKAVERGAQDYLSKTALHSPELVRALQYGIIRSRKQAEERRPSQTAAVVALLGSKGGVGVTTLACHMAREFKKQAPGEVLLAGIDANAEGVAYLMKAATQYTLADAAQNLHRLDADLWKAFVFACADGVEVLAPAGAAQLAPAPEADRVRHVLRFARGLYGRVVLDLGVPGPLSLTLLEDATEIVVVASENLPALREAGRLLHRLTELGIPRESLRFVLNFRKKRGGVPAADLEKALGYPLYGSVVAALEEEEEMLAEGRFADEKSPIRKDVAKIVAKLLGQEPDEPSGGFRLSRLVGG
jgi:Flp pilus assembly CpaE family ATPase